MTQNLDSDLGKLPIRKGAKKVPTTQGVVMTEAREFWQFVEEAMQCASQSEDENEKLDFIWVASTWARAALTSQMIYRSSVISPGREARN